ncbi:MAG: phosphoribosylglycinamide formyltransferase [Gammaproteobacteria bacterium]|nr:MAG: phosphoribosylglycinamide formyltransferase [Gammaproteobacteria bacterium]
MTAAPCKVVALISGRGSNLQAIIDQAQAGKLNIDLCAVISNCPQAQGLARAETAGIATHALDHAQFPNRRDFEATLEKTIDQYRPRLVLLAGFMRVLSPEFVRHYEGRMINIHPSLLPSYPGLNTHARALENKETQHGATVHFVTPEVDAGPLIIQRAVPVMPDDNPDTLAARVLETEHRIYPQAVAWFSEGRLTISNGKVLLDGQTRPEQGLIIDSN